MIRKSFVGVIVSSWVSHIIENMKFMSLFTRNKEAVDSTPLPEIVLDDKDIIEVSWDGDVTWKSYANALQTVFQIASELEMMGKDIKVLVDFSEIDNIEARTPHIASRGLKDIPYKKIAEYGIKPKHQLLLDQIKEDARLNKGTIRDFLTSKSALKCLEQG